MKKYLLPVLFILFFLSLSLTQIITTDTWWNLSDGRMFYSAGRLPVTDPYSYVTEGKPWTNGYWLSGVLLYPIYRMGGGAALVLFQSLVAGFIFFLLSTIRHRNSLNIISIFLVLTILIAQPRFQVRAELFGLLSTALLLWLMFQYQRGLSLYKASLAIVLTIIFWTNAHASFPQSFLILCVFLVGELLAAMFKRRGYLNPDLEPLSRSRWVPLAGIFLVSLLATGITPYAFRIWQIPKFFIAQHKFVSQNLNEWIPLSFSWLGDLDSFIAASIVLAILGGFFGIALNWRKTSISWALLWLASLAMFASSVRHMSFFAMVTLPVLALNWNNVSIERARLARVSKKWVRGATYGLMLFVTFDWLTDWSVIQRASHEAFGVGFYNRTIPKEAVQFAIKNQFSERVFNTYDLGSYLMFHWPEQKVFIDTRMWFRGADDFQVYVDLMREPEKYWDGLADKYNIQTVILKHLSREVDLLLPHLAKHPGWAIVFCDARGIVFLKRTNENATWIDKYAPHLDLIGLFERAEMEYRPHWFWDKARLFKPREIPYELYWVAHLYFRLGMHDNAEKAFLRVLEFAPELHDVYYWLGKIAVARKDFASAVKHFEKCLSLKPSFAPAQQELKLSRMLVGFRAIYP